MILSENLILKNNLTILTRVLQLFNVKTFYKIKNKMKADMNDRI